MNEPNAPGSFIKESEWKNCQRIRDVEDSRVSQLEQMMKSIEKAYSMDLDISKPYIARLDGNNSHWKKPYDVRLQNAILLTAADLLKRFNAQFAYVQTDEISLIFLAPSERPGMKRVIRIVSLFAGYASARFNFHLSSQPYAENETMLRELSSSGSSYFDCRVFSLPDQAACLTNIALRTLFCRRNSQAGLGRLFYGHAPIQSLPSKYIAKKLLEEANIDWHSMNDFFKWGVYIKRATQVDGGIGVRTGGVILESTEDFSGEKDDQYQQKIESLMEHLFEDTAALELKNEFLSAEQYVQESVRFDEELDRVYNLSLEFKAQYNQKSLDCVVINLDDLLSPIPSYGTAINLSLNTAKQILVGWFSRFSMSAPVYEVAACGSPPTYFTSKVVLPILPAKHPKGKPVAKLFGIGEDTTLKGAQKNAALSACEKLLQLGTLQFLNGAHIQRDSV